MLSEKYGVKVQGIQGPSMQPTLDSQDNLVLLDSFTVKVLRDPKKGEVIISENPLKPGFTITKRVIGLPNETVKFWHYGQQQDVEVKVPEGHLWLEGDNKEYSKDSRNFGPVPLALVDGICRYRIWPLDKFEKL